MASLIIIILSLLLLRTPTIASSDFSKYLNNPILSTGPKSWDNTDIFAPAVINDGTEYKMYYAGTDGSRYQIGLAHSSDGINWLKDENNPVLSRLEVDDHDVTEPTVIFNGSKYEMWYNGFKRNNGTIDFSVYRAISDDGIHWTPNPLTPVLRPTTGWGSAASTNPFVLKTGSEYKMWFTAPDTGNWSVGYASSPDGINWTPYSGNPVLIGDQPWDGNQIGGTTVIFDGGSYHMWYGTNSIGSNTKIIYAFSTDGIHWSKPSSFNPVLVPDQIEFDEEAVGDGSALKVDNTIYLWYNGVGTIDSIRASRIGLATEGNISPPTTKVVVIPGFGASWNPDAILNCKSSGYTGDWTLAPYAQSIYSPLLSILPSVGLTANAYFYDWRQPIVSQASRLRETIESLTATNEKVHVVGHSMGGLLGRAYLESSGNQNRISKLLTVGTPHAGTPLAYPAWSGGEIWDDNFILKLAMTILVKHCGKNYGNTRETIRSIIPSVQNFLPTSDYLRDQTTKVLKPVPSMNARNNYLPTTTFASPFFGATVGTLSGVGYKTLQYILVKDQTRRDIALGNWIDGNPVRREKTIDGDGTVLAASSTVTGAINAQINQSHTGLMTSANSINRILNFLQGISESPQARVLAPPTEPTSALLIIGYPAEFSVVDPTGTTIQSTNGMVAVMNPAGGTYRLRLVPKGKKTQIIVGQFLQDGRVFWKEYTYAGLQIKRGSILLDPLNPREDALR